MAAYGKEVYCGMGTSWGSTLLHSYSCRFNAYSFWQVAIRLETPHQQNSIEISGFYLFTYFGTELQS